jgi:hypothetical protein
VPRKHPAQPLHTPSSLGATTIRRRARLGRLRLVATVELVAKFREVFEQSNRPWILRPERRLIDQEGTLIEILGPTILALTGHRRRRVGESSAHEDIRRAERLFHEKRHSRVENLSPVELAERSIDAGKIRQRPHQLKILRSEGTLVEWERSLIEHFSFLVVTAVRGLLGPKPELEAAPKIIDTILLSNFVNNATTINDNKRQ